MMDEVETTGALDSRKAEIVELVKQDLDGRRALGLTKYGRPLTAGNGRHALQDAYEEALDLVQYLRQEITERAVETTGAPDPREMESRIEKLRNLVAVQGFDGNWNYDHYMRGMFNGMELALSVLEGREPQYRDAPEAAAEPVSQV
jgi:hypothetical protein